jgi:neutral ceramidase
MGFGPDAERARGYRHRIYARALVLEDANGERVALVAADLGQVSLLLQREVADRVVGETGIGADRLVLAATHSHAGPGHIFESKTYNDIGGAVRGFDPAVVAFLADRIAKALREAAGSLTSAVAGWAKAPLWGSTWNRSYEAYLLNPTGRPKPRPPAGLDPRQGAVDPTWTLLRVDTISAAGDTVPAGAFSVFAVHGTANTVSNDLFDGDVHALPERGLERHIDGLLGVTGEFEPRSVHVLANGAEGDVSPGSPGEDICEPPGLRRGRRPGGPRSPPALDAWHSSARRPGSPCLREARDIVNQVGDAMAGHAVALFDRAATGLRGDLTITRAFRTVDLTGPAAPPGLCEDAQPGSGMAGGTEDGRTSLHGWRLLGLFPLGAEEGQTDPGGDECQRPKKPVHWAIRFGVGPLELPRHMQLMVIRIGPMLITAAPVELTTEAGFRLEEAMLREATARGLPIRSAALIGLANGYMQYVATPEEYEAQHYEGGSTLYGPGTLGVIEAQMSDMIAELATGGGGERHTPGGAPGPGTLGLSGATPGVSGSPTTSRGVVFRGRRHRALARRGPGHPDPGRWAPVAYHPAPPGDRGSVRVGRRSVPGDPRAP